MSLQGKSEKSVEARKQWQGVKRNQAVSRFQEACFELIAEEGYEKTTIKKIASRAGYSEQSFFRYYSSKEDCALNSLMPAEFIEAFLESANKRWSTEPIREVGIHIFEDVLALPESCTWFDRIAKLQNLSDRFPGLAGAMYNRRAHVIDQVQEQLVDPENLEDLILVIFVFEFVESILRWWARTPEYEQSGVESLLPFANTVKTEFFAIFDGTK